MFKNLNTFISLISSKKDFQLSAVILGYHGTEFSRAVTIRDTQTFKPSNSGNDWLGDGVYFFVDGIGLPQSHAAEWAKSRSYSTGNKRIYGRYAVLKSQITNLNSDEIFDLTTLEAIEAFNAYIKGIIEVAEIKEIASKWNMRNIWNEFMSLNGIKLIKKNVYIKTGYLKEYDLHTHVENCTIACVTDNKCITAIEIVENGVV